MTSSRSRSGRSPAEHFIALQKKIAEGDDAAQTWAAFCVAAARTGRERQAREAYARLPEGSELRSEVRRLLEGRVAEIGGAEAWDPAAPATEQPITALTARAKPRVRIPPPRERTTRRVAAVRPGSSTPQSAPAEEVRSNATDVASVPIAGDARAAGRHVAVDEAASPRSAGTDSSGSGRREQRSDARTTVVRGIVGRASDAPPPEVVSREAADSVAFVLATDHAPMVASAVAVVFLLLGLAGFAGVGSGLDAVTIAGLSVGFAAAVFLAGFARRSMFGAIDGLQDAPSVRPFGRVIWLGMRSLADLGPLAAVCFAPAIAASFLPGVFGSVLGALLALVGFSVLPLAFALRQVGRVGWPEFAAAVRGTGRVFAAFRGCGMSYVHAVGLMALGFAPALLVAPFVPATMSWFTGHAILALWVAPTLFTARMLGRYLDVARHVLEPSLDLSEHSSTATRRRAGTSSAPADAPLAAAIAQPRVTVSRHG